jgi:hypothetical protein
MTALATWLSQILSDEQGQNSRPNFKRQEMGNPTLFDWAGQASTTQTTYLT